MYTAYILSSDPKHFGLTGRFNAGSGDPKTDTFLVTDEFLAENFSNEKLSFEN